MTAATPAGARAIPPRSYAALGRSLPPIRPGPESGLDSALVRAKVTRPDPRTWLRPSARQRWIGPVLSTYTPQMIEYMLRGAVSGDLTQQHELFSLMEDTWPMLTQALGELRESVCALERTVMPFAPRGEKPDEQSLRRARVVEEALYGMRPRQDRDELDLDGTIWELMDARGKGISVLEIDWETRRAGDGSTIIAPRSTHWVHPRCYQFGDSDGDRLMLVADAVRESGGDFVRRANGGGVSLMPIPENKFIVGILKGRSGHPCNTALLRTLGFWWAAMNFCGEWFLNYAQIFGQPLRLGYYDPSLSADDKLALETFLQHLGSSAWAVFPAGTQIELKEAAAGAAQNPQFALMEFADKICTIVIKRQTLTTDIREKGSLAAGEVHERGYQGVIQACGDWCGRVLTAQLIRPICRLNFGDDAEAPWLTLRVRERMDRKSAAEGLTAARAAGVSYSAQWAREILDIPEPGPDEELIGPQTSPPPGVQPPPPQPPFEARTPVRHSVPAAARAANRPPTPDIARAAAPDLARARAAVYQPLLDLIAEAQTADDALAACERHLLAADSEERARVLESAMQDALIAGAGTLP